jgi:uncharacterized protein
VPGPVPPSARVALAALLALALCAVNEARADLDANVKRCRSDIVRIGEDPKSPYEQYCLGLSYQFALNRNRDSTKALNWLRRAAAQNFAPAQAVLGYMLEQGIGTAKNPAEAVQWYRRAAEQNDPDGLMNLGRAHEHGVGGVARDLGQARTYYERASSLGSAPAREALKGLGSASPAPAAAQEEFARGATLYKSKDYAGAVRIFRGLADRGYAPAQLQIGSQYARGQGLPRDDRLASQWYRKAAEQNYAIAQNNLAENYEQGRGVPEDWAESRRWAKRSADQGNAYGMLLVGRAYQFGIGVPQSREEAVRWFERAAEKGDNQADYWARWLRGRGNFIGFRNDEEQAFVIGGKLRTDTQLVFAEPRGILFRTSAERQRYLRDLRGTTDRNEAMAAWNRRAERYAACKRGETGDSYCSEPGPPP